MDPEMRAMDRAYREAEIEEAKAIAWQEGFEAALRWARDVHAKSEPNPYRATPVEKRKTKARRASAR